MLRKKEIEPGYRIEDALASGIHTRLEQNQHEVLDLLSKVTPRLRTVRSGGAALKFGDVSEFLLLVKLEENNAHQYEIVGLACFKFEVRKKDGKRIMRYFGSIVSPGESRGLQQQLHAQALKYLKECDRAQVIDLSTNDSLRD